MSIIKSFSFPVGNIRGDMFYIEHNSNNFTVIDCYLKDGDDASCRKEELIKEIVARSKGRVCRFISTHPHDDHIRGLEELDKEWTIRNFYAVENNKPKDPKDASLSKYHQLKNDPKIMFGVKKGIKRKWLNEGDTERGGSGINFLWPVLDNKLFKEELISVSNGGQPNNISCAFTYSIENGAKYMFMGDMEKKMSDEFYKSEKDNIPQIDILFHPHHGRKSSALSAEFLQTLNPKIIIIGNAPHDDLNYDDPDRTITQNTAGDLRFDNDGAQVHIHSSNKYQNPPACLEKVKGQGDIYMNGGKKKWFYMGTLKIK